MRESLKKILFTVFSAAMILLVTPQVQARAEDVVVVLDPGHGGAESGAFRTWNKVKYQEELLTLKIAQYAKAELETYEGVKVYLTRYDNNTTMDRLQRVQKALAYNADCLVSLHINSTGTATTEASGACAMVPSTQKYSNSKKYAKNARTLANVILTQLSASVGVRNNGFQYGDELGIILYGMKAKIPSMIIEHCFVNNSSDCKLYLSSNAKLQKLGAADAAGIAKFYGLKKKTGGVTEPTEPVVPVVTGWQKENGKYYYYDSNGVKQVGVTAIGESLYLLDNTGARLTGFQKLNGRYYYANSKGKLYIGWKNYKDKRYYFGKKSGAAQVGLIKIGKYKYYFSKTGVLKKKWQTIGGKRYYFSKVNGRLLTNYWLKYNGKWYYLNSQGTPYKSTTKKINGKKYKFNKSGVCTNRK